MFKQHEHLIFCILLKFTCLCHVEVLTGAVIQTNPDAEAPRNLPSSSLWKLLPLLVSSRIFFLLCSPSSSNHTLRFVGFDAPLFQTLHHLLDAAEDPDNKSINAPTKTYVSDAKAMAATPADVKELPKSFVFVVDMPGLKSGDIKVQVEDDNVLVITGERKREVDKEDVKYLRMERRIGKFMRKFVLPENADTEKITAACLDGVLSVTVEKLPPPQPKKPKTIEVKIA